MVSAFIWLIRGLRFEFAVIRIECNIIVSLLLVELSFFLNLMNGAEIVSVQLMEKLRSNYVNSTGIAIVFEL